VAYPKNYRELGSRLHTQEKCLEYLAAIRWKDGFICPSCGGKNYWRSKRLLWICSACEFQASVLSGTLFQDTKLPLNVWFQMIWWFMGQKSGANALSLQRNFGIGRCRSAWRLLAKLRSCTVSPTRDQLSGDVEVDEVFLGGVNNKEIIGVAAEKLGRATGRIRLKHIKSREAVAIQGFIVEVIAPGSKITSDRHRSYIKIVEKGYAHSPQRKPYMWEEVDGNDDRLLPRLHRVAALLKRWHLGTYHGGMDMKEIQPYLDEFVFRFNRRTSGSRGLIFHRLVEAALRPINSGL